MTSQPQVQRRRLRRWHLWLVVVLIPLGMYGYGVVREWRAESRLARAVAAANAEDPNWQLDTLRTDFDRLPANEHLLAALNEIAKAPLYLGWYGDDFPARPGGLSYSVAVHPHARMPSQYLTILRDRLNAPSVVPLRRAVDRFVEQPSGRFPEPSHGLDKSRLLDRVNHLRNYKSDECLLAIHEGRIDDAIDHIRGHLALSLPLKDSPGLVPRLISMRALGGASDSTQTLLAQATLTDLQLARLQQHLLSHSQTDKVSFLKLLRAAAHDELHRLRTDSAYRDDYNRRTFSRTVPSNAPWNERMKARLDPWIGPWLSGSLTEHHAEVIECLNGAIALARQDPNRTFANEAWMLKWNKVHHPLAPYAKMVFAFETTTMLMEATVAAVACERFRLIKGHWPTSLSEIVPNYLPRLPIDPYTGQHLLYRVLEDGAVIYSVWQNRVDNGGRVLDGEFWVDRDRGIRLYNPDKRGLKYEEVYRRPEE